jgi:hypothetical protein
MTITTETNGEKTYVLKVTSANKEKAIPFYGSYLTGSAKGALITQIKEVTPFELFAKTAIFGCMINASDMVSVVGVEICEKESIGEVIVAGEGITNLAHVDTKGESFIYSK